MISSPALAQPCTCANPVCGPGPHWVDNCAGGIDIWGIDGAIVGIDFDGDCKADQSVVFTNAGPPLQVSRQASSDDSAQFPGLRLVDGHLDVIDTEIVAMNLASGGMTLIAGLGKGTNPAGPLVNNSFGAIAEFTANPAVAESFFDVYFELDLGAGGGYVYNQVPLTVMVDANGIACVPPDCQYFKAGQCIPCTISRRVESWWLT